MIEKIKDIIRIFKLTWIEFTKNKTEAKKKILELDSFLSDIEKERSTILYIRANEDTFLNQVLLKDNLKLESSLYKIASRLDNIMGQLQVRYVYARSAIRSQNYREAIEICNQALKTAKIDYNFLITTFREEGKIKEGKTS